MQHCFEGITLIRLIPLIRGLFLCKRDNGGLCWMVQVHSTIISTTKFSNQVQNRMPDIKQLYRLVMSDVIIITVLVFKVLRLFEKG